ncbi:MAG: hypothetical protein LUE12_04715 [Ruminococcus sp.]|nr:hypothetical protein [Ruminococcus sp.]
MADNKFSVDDILKEYETEPSSGGLDVEDIIKQVNEESNSKTADAVQTQESVEESTAQETADVKRKNPIESVFDRLKNEADTLERFLDSDEGEQSDEIKELDADEPILSFDKRRADAENAKAAEKDADQSIETEVEKADGGKSESAEAESDGGEAEAEAEEAVSSKASDEANEASQADTEKEADSEESVDVSGEELDADEPKTESDEVSDNSDEESEAENSESEAYSVKKKEIYHSRRNNRGAAFTLRTSDDSDKSKADSHQEEYTERGQESAIFEEIARLKRNLTVRAAVLLFAAAFSLFITVANDLSLTMTTVFDRTINPSAYLFVNTILGIVAIGFSYSVIVNGFKSILDRRPDTDSIVAINILAAVIAGLVVLFDSESLKASFYHLYTCSAILGLLFNTLGKLSVAERTRRNFEYVSQTDSFSAVQLVEDDNTAAYITNGSSGSRKELASMRRTGFVKDFMKNSYSSDLADLFAQKTTPIVLAAALVVGLMSIAFEQNSSGTAEKFFVFLASISGTLSICTSFSLSLVANVPLSRASRKLIDYSGVMLGYSSAEEFAEVNSVMVDAGHLFPTGTVEFVNLKMLGSVVIDKAIVYAASMANAGKSVTQPAFYKMLRGNTNMILPVKGCISESNMGVSGWIENKRVLMGSRELMIKHSIDGLPSPESEDAFAGKNSVMYLSVSGRVIMVFAVSLSVGPSAKRWVQELEDEFIEINVRSSDGFITRSLISRLFDISPSTVKLMPSSCDGDYERLTEPVESMSASLFCSGHLPTFAMMLVAAKKVKYSVNIGIAVQYGSMILGIILCIIMMVTGTFSQITPTIVTIYNLVFMLLMYLLQSIKKL